jgi:hypothetical protein
MVLPRFVNVRPSAREPPRIHTQSWAGASGERSYHRARAADTAREELIREAGRQFDPAVTAAFLEVLDEPEPPLLRVAGYSAAGFYVRRRKGAVDDRHDV